MVAEIDEREGWRSQLGRVNLGHGSAFAFHLTNRFNNAVISVHQTRAEAEKARGGVCILFRWIYETRCKPL